MLKSSPQSWPSRIVARWKAATRTTQTTPRSTPLVEPPARPVVARQRRSAARAPAVTSYAPARAVLRPDVLRRDGRVRAGRVQAAVAPHDLHLGAVALGGEGVGEPGDRGRGLAEQLGRFRLDARGIAEAERPERGVHRVTGDVTQGAGAEVPPAAPL